MTNEAIDYTTQIKDLQARLQAPFAEINTKLAALKKQQADTQKQLDAITNDELMTAAGIANKRSLTETLADIKTAIETATKEKIQIAKDNESMAHSALVEFYNAYRSDAEKASNEQFEKPINDLLQQVKSLDT